MSTYRSAQSVADSYLTIGGTAAALAVNRITVRRWLQSGRLHGERVGKVTLIPKAEVEALARARASAEG